MPNFRHVIRDAYVDILQRVPDPGGLESFNRAMNSGLTEAQLHEALLRSPEYAQRFPETQTTASKEPKPRARGARRKPAKKGRRG